MRHRRSELAGQAIGRPGRRTAETVRRPDDRNAATPLTGSRPSRTLNCGRAATAHDRALIRASPADQRAGRLRRRPGHGHRRRGHRQVATPGRGHRATHATRNLLAAGELSAARRGFAVTADETGHPRIDEVRWRAILKAVLTEQPGYVRSEIARLLPELEPGTSFDGADAPAEGWRRERMFTALHELLSAVARRHPVALVIEDMHWADQTTMDLLRVLVGDGYAAPIPIAVSCRDREPSANPAANDWQATVRLLPGVMSLPLSPLDRDQTSEQVAALLGYLPTIEALDALFRRSEGNPVLHRATRSGRPDHRRAGSVTDARPDATGPGRIAQRPSETIF